MEEWGIRYMKVLAGSRLRFSNRPGKKKVVNGRNVQLVVQSTVTVFIGVMKQVAADITQVVKGNKQIVKSAVTEAVAVV